MLRLPCPLSCLKGLCLPDTGHRTESHLPRKKGIYHGWTVAAVSFLATAGAVGFAHYGFGLFIVPLEEEFGWSRTQINLALVLGVMMQVVSPFVGRVLDLFGSRYVMTVSLAAVAAGFILRSVMVDLWQFYLFSILVFAGGPGAAMLPAGRLVTLWFPATRGRMMGLVTAGNNFGGLLSVPILTYIIVFQGWRAAFLFTGIFLAVTAVLALLFVRDRPEDIESESGKRWAPAAAATDAARKLVGGLAIREALSTRAFWFLAAGMTLQQFVRTTMVTQLAAHLEDSDFSATQVGAALSVLAFFGITSKVVFGGLSEAITARWSYALVVAIQVVGVAGFLFVAGGNFMLVFVSLSVFGLGMGGIGTLGPLAVTEMFGLRNYGAISGLIRQGVAIPGIVGPLLAGGVFDATGSYDLAFRIILGFLALSCLCFVLARPPKWREQP